jgi:hypothetical protein
MRVLTVAAALLAVALPATGVAAALLAVALPATGAPGPPAHVKNTNGWIESLAMDGPRVAYAVQGRSTCTKVFVWNIQTRGGVQVSGRGTCGADSTSTGGGVTEIAVADTRLAWIVNKGGNTESSDTLYSALLPAPRERRVADALRTGNADGTLTGSWLAGLVGGGDRIVLNQFTTDSSGTVATAALQRLGTGLTTIAAGKATIRALSLDQRRIAVLRPDQKVALYDTETGRLLLTAAPSSAREVALRKDYIVVLTRTKTLEIFNARTGAAVRVLPVAAGATKLDVYAGIAAYAVGRVVHVLRLADGRDTVLAIAPRAIAGLVIEAPGIACAYNTVRGIRDVGNLAFVPMRRATSLLS